MNQISWGMIGCGEVTEVKSGPAFNKIAGSRLAAVMCRNGDKAKDYAQRHGVPKWYDDADKLLHDPEINAIYVATPPASHAEYTIRAAEAKKPVYVEKPMARHSDECTQMIKACEKAGVPLFVAYYRRCLPAFLKIKELVASGAVGEVRLVTINLYHPPRREDLHCESLPWRVMPEIAGGGYFLDLASHQLDFLDFVFGPIVSAKGHAANQAKWYPAEDVVSASFVFESGVMGTGMWCFTVSNSSRRDRTEMIGSRGKIIYSTFERMPIRLETNTGVEEFQLPTPEHVQQPLIQTIVDELQGRGTCPSTGLSAARTSRVMDAILNEWRRQQVQSE
ncbi:MAG: Gfo/Idh/MocA family oxidoreductase [candidate division KSB1 bacterium]|nr:Gfo/Idh/MocA family oxidoreductase [candidate division KSB1 bacterium]